MILGPYESIATLVDTMAHRHLPYYHPNLTSMVETRTLMMDYVMQDGAFILRNSFSQPGKLTVTVMYVKQDIKLSPWGSPHNRV